MDVSGKPIEYDRMSMISQASMAVSQIPKNDLVEVKSFANPPEAVKEVFLAVLMLLGHKTTEVNWKMAKKELSKFGEKSIQQKVLSLDVDKIPEENILRAKEILSKYDEDKIAKVSKAVKALYVWGDAVTTD